MKKKLEPRSRVQITRLDFQVFRSNKFIYAQIIDDLKGKTLRKQMMFKWGRVPRAPEQRKGRMIALALKEKIEQVVFDRNGFKYTGRIKLVQMKLGGGLKFKIKNGKGKEKE